MYIVASQTVGRGFHVCQLSRACQSSGRFLKCTRSLIAYAINSPYTSSLLCAVFITVGVQKSCLHLYNVGRIHSGKHKAAARCLSVCKLCRFFSMLMRYAASVSFNPPARGPTNSFNGKMHLMFCYVCIVCSIAVLCIRPVHSDVYFNSSTSTGCVKKVSCWF